MEHRTHRVRHNSRRRTLEVQEKWHVTPRMPARKSASRLRIVPPSVENGCQSPRKSRSSPSSSDGRYVSDIPVSGPSSIRTQENCRRKYKPMSARPHRPLRDSLVAMRACRIDLRHRRECSANIPHSGEYLLWATAIPAATRSSDRPSPHGKRGCSRPPVRPSSEQPPRSSMSWGRCLRPRTGSRLSGASTLAS
jgi:hypothetical protein